LLWGETVGGREKKKLHWWNRHHGRKEGGVSYAFLAARPMAGAAGNAKTFSERNHQRGKRSRGFVAELIKQKK